MLCRRAVVHHTLRVRHVSQQELLDSVKRVHSFNPITKRPSANSDDNPSRAGPDDGPPRAGLNGYASPKENPHNRQRAAQMTEASRLRSNYRFDCQSTRNNTITTLSSITYPEDPLKPPTSKVIAWFSGGSVGFKKGQRAGYEAGHQCAVRVFRLLEELKTKEPVRVDVYFKGFGQGREALKSALMATEGDKIRDTIKHVIDRTPLKIGGTRAKKTRRL